MIRILHQGNFVAITLQADILNQSQQRFDLLALQRAIISQLQAVYHNSIGKYSLDVISEINIINSVFECSPNRVLFQIVDAIPGNNPAEADFKGLRVKLNKAAILDIINGINFRTIPHEIGHLLGLDHPHDRAAFESINPKAHNLEQALTEEERQHNLMSQTWYIQKAKVDLRNAVQLTEKQLDAILLYYKSRQLNKNRHLKYFLLWRKLV